jgi:hypothetical protein
MYLEQEEIDDDGSLKLFIMPKSFVGIIQELLLLVAPSVIFMTKNSNILQNYNSRTIPEN